MQSAIRIREATDSDFEAVMRLYRQLNPDDPVLEDGSDQAAYEQIMKTKGLQIFVCELDGRIAATCYLNIVPNVTRRASPYGIIENVVTEVSLRGKGLGKAVVSHALQQAWSAGCYKVMLQTGSQRESTHAFYRACGFTDEKVAFVARPPE
jgi:GNAT superfamily N-acetyltransferase